MAAVNILLPSSNNVHFIVVSLFLGLDLPIVLFCSDFAAIVHAFTNPPSVIHTPVSVRI
jgi:hypothetical protein